MLCKSGKHEWSREEDASKCCAGYRRVAVFGDDAIRSSEVPLIYDGQSETLIGYRWDRLTFPMMGKADGI